jgi:hypothetical protein
VSILEWILIIVSAHNLIGIWLISSTVENILSIVKEMNEEEGT